MPDARPVRLGDRVVQVPYGDVAHMATFRYSDGTEHSHVFAHSAKTRIEAVLLDGERMARVPERDWDSEGDLYD